MTANQRPTEVAIATAGTPTPTDFRSLPDLIVGSTTSLAPILIDPEDSNDSIKLSRRRWLVLFAISIFGFAVALTSETSSIFLLFMKVLDIEVKEYLYINQVFYYVMAFTAVPTAYFVDKYGIKVALYSASALFFLHGTFKALLFYPDLPGWSANKTFYWIVSSLLGTQMFAMYFVLPLKISESWFSESERSVAWTVMISQLNLGVCISAFIFPRVMKDVPDVKFLAYLNIISVVTTAIVSVTCVTQSNPKHPPNKRVAVANNDTAPFRVSFIRMLKHCDIMIHLIHLSIIESVILSAGSALQDVFKSIGHTDLFAGNFISLSALIALVMQLILAAFVHRVTNVTLTCKVGSLIHGLLFVTYLLTLILRLPGWIIITVYIMFTICKSWVMPNFTNMTAHLACGTVPQATIIGFSLTVTVVIMTVIQTTFASLIQIHDKKNFYGNSLIFLIVVSLLNDAIYLVAFRGNSAKQLGINNSNDNSDQIVSDNRTVGVR